MKTYLLPCGCGREIAVTPADAGGEAPCPGCGGTVPVPKLRDLGKLREAVPVVTKRSSHWTAGHTAILVGLLLAATSGLLAQVFRAQTPPPSVDVHDIERQMQATSYVNAYGNWATELRHRPIAPPLTPEELAYRNAEAVNAMWRRRFTFTAAAALALALTGLLAVVLRRAAEGRTGATR